MTLSGTFEQLRDRLMYTVLIPLLVDDPLWEFLLQLFEKQHSV